MKKKLVAGVLCAAMVVPTAASAAYQGYVGYSLPSFSGNNYTGYHEKATSDDYIKNIVENYEGTSTGNFWAQDSGGSISSKYNQKEGSYAKINFNQGGKSKGNDVRMAMENEEYWSTNAFVAGRVDFR
ncbi:hypothetical protein [Anaerobacillus sp. 1_MG-2023]|uniref:hypothetical protein n=1 Tax=Bacillales TaxID=1385 RepID=UPI0026E3DB24|nr:hypothetical protein [Anaerobacillus sp. 1_MG-2023]MDO6657185.1 hypothetical protein [Anaerobacillus sp. 1_MG-2023]